MAFIQEIKITSKLGEVFFFEHSLKSARQHADDYVKRNTGRFPMKVYSLSSKPAPFPKWELVKAVNCGQ